MWNTTPKNHQPARIYRIQIKYQLEVCSTRLRENVASWTTTGFSKSQLTTSLITPATRKWVLGVKHYCTMSAMCSLPRETVRFHTLHLQPVNVDQWRQQPTVHLAVHCGWWYHERNAHPRMSPKWLKVTISMQKCFQAFQEGLYSKKYACKHGIWKQCCSPIL